MTTENNKPKKVKGPFRTEAIIPFTIIVGATFLYFHFLFDMNLKSLLETAGYYAVGAEVNIAKVETSFLRANLRIQGIEVTDPSMPAKNLIKLGDIRFGVLWDGLLRARFVVEEMAVEQIEIGSTRKYPGKVKPPPPPPPPKDDKPSEFEKKAKEISEKALQKTQDQNSGNVLGDIAGILSGTSTSDQKTDEISKNLASKAKMQEFEKTVSAKQAQWVEKIKTLPGSQEIQALGDKISKVKTQNFSSPQEALESIKAIEAVVKEADEKVKKVQNTSQELNGDIKALNDGLAEIDKQIKKDIEDIEARFKIPKLDAKSLTMSILRPYVQPYLERVNQYKAMADKYVPPNLMKKGDKNENKDAEIKPHPRARGMTYEFGKKNSYPMFWIKQISISSKPSAAFTADMKGKITDITSNQTLIGKPTMIQFAGSFPTEEILGIKSSISINATGSESIIDGNFSIESMAVAQKEFVNSNDAKIILKNGKSNLNSNFRLLGLTKLDFTLNSTINKADYDISAQNPQLEEILKTVFAGIPTINIEMKAQGELPTPDIALNSNLGPELEKGFRAQINKKVDELKAKINAQVQGSVREERAKIEAQINQIKNTADAEIKKVSDQINKEKSKGDAKSNQAKKDSENQGKKKAEDAAKGAADDLKKRLGF